MLVHGFVRPYVLLDGKPTYIRHSREKVNRITTNFCHYDNSIPWQTLLLDSLSQNNL